MSNVRPMRSLLTWDEILEIQQLWKNYAGIARDIKRLVRHIKMMECINGQLLDDISRNKRMKK